MPITRLLQNASFGPDEINILVRAFEEALGTLRVDRNDPISDALAKKIIELAQRGERDPILFPFAITCSRRASTTRNPLSESRKECRKFNGGARVFSWCLLT